MEARQLDFVDEFPQGFFYWLKKNEHIYRAFKAKALSMAMTGRKRYSARTIVEVLRWNSDLEDTEKTFKINDHYTPGMAKLWMQEHGERYPKFFELRK